MEKLTSKAKVLILISIFIVVSLSGMLLLHYGSKQPLEINAHGGSDPFVTADPTPTPTPTPESTPTRAPEIMVHIKGAVVSPGVYTLNSGARLSDAISAAGGYTPEASEVSVNLALVLQDQDEIIIPAKSGAAKSSSSGSGSTGVVKSVTPKTSGGQQKSAPVAPTTDNKLNINTATASQLELLPGIGEKLSVSIVEYRQKNGEFVTIEEIMKVSGIGEKRFEAMKDVICVK